MNYISLIQGHSDGVCTFSSGEAVSPASILFEVGAGLEFATPAYHAESGSYHPLTSVRGHLLSKPEVQAC